MQKSQTEGQAHRPYILIRPSMNPNRPEPFPDLYFYYSTIICKSCVEYFIPIVLLFYFHGGYDSSESIRREIVRVGLSGPAESPKRKKKKLWRPRRNYASHEKSR